MPLRLEMKTFWSRDVPDDVRAAATKRAKSFVEEMESLGVLIRSEDVEETEYSIGADKPVTFRFSEVDQMRRTALTAIGVCAEASNTARNDKDQDRIELFLVELAEMRDSIEKKIGG